MSMEEAMVDKKQQLSVVTSMSAQQWWIVLSHIDDGFGTGEGDNDAGWLWYDKQ